MKCRECPEYKACHRKADLRRVRHRCPLAKAPLKPKPQTHADQIRKDTNEGLAATIHAVSLGWAPWCDHHCANQGEDGCDNCIKDWLAQPAEEEKE